ncbi:MAG TPA: aldehyde dehydrogenase family protein [Hyphomicrobiales bacterium]|nr:aldehyde dehydrogenase family protein [Hyphomicrobiales bacterium]
MQEYQLFIDNEYVPSASGVYSDDMNPATNSVYARVQNAGKADLERVLSSSAKAFETWKDMLPSARERLFLKAADLMDERAKELAEVLIDEAGSTLLKAGYETHHTPSFLRSMAGEVRRVKGETYVSDYPGVKSYCIRRPLGVVVSIAPFNFPLLLGIRKIGFALAAGNTVILKPSEMTPVIGLKLGELLRDAGFPPGVLNVIPALGAELGDDLITDKRVKFVTFTGSSRVGRQVGATAAAHGKRFALEMGGKNPIIVLNDADVDYAVDTAAFSNFMHQGQICMTGSRVIVEAGIYDSFCDKLAKKVAGLKHGPNPREPGLIVGPLIRTTQAPFIKDQLDKAVAEGARVLTGGHYQDNVFEPTVVADVTQPMSIFRTECFGPVASVIKANDHVHALELANDSEYGLSSAVLTNDLQKAIFLSEGLEAGAVHINGPSVRDEPVIPFGGVKNSGTGREGGHFSMDEMTELKWITIQTGQNRYPF